MQALSKFILYKQKHNIQRDIMKKILVTILLTFCSLYCFAQVSSGTWDDETATYTNKHHKLSWTIWEGMDWIGRPITNKNTLLKVKNEDINTLITLNAEPIINNKNFDIWYNLDMYSSTEAIRLSKEEAKRLGMELKSQKATRTQICGRHANKVIIDMAHYLSLFDTYTHSVTYIYQVATDRYIYTLQLWGMTINEKDLKNFDTIVNMIVNKFNLE